jgi:protein TonB
MLGAAILVQFVFVIAFVYRPAPAEPALRDIAVAIVSPVETPPDTPVVRPPDPTPPKLAMAVPVLPAIRIDSPPASPASPSMAITQPAPPPPPLPIPSVGIEDQFKSAVRAAVFAADRVPESARLLGLYGDTRVGFSLRDTRVSNVHMIASSGHESLDEAALRAVRVAAYPEPPPTLRGRLLDFEVTVYHRRTAT